MYLGFSSMQLAVAALASLTTAVLSYSKQQTERPIPKFNSGAIDFLKIFIQEGGVTCGATYLSQNFGVVIGLACYFITQVLTLRNVEQLPSLALKTWLLSTPQGAVLVIWTSVLQEATSAAVQAFRYERLHIKVRTVALLFTLAGAAIAVALLTQESLIKVHSCLAAFWVVSRLILVAANSYRAVFFLAPQALLNAAQNLEDSRRSLPSLGYRLFLSVLVGGFSFFQLPQLPLAIGVPLATLSLFGSILTSKREVAGPRSEQSDGQQQLKLRRLLVVLFWIVMMLVFTRSTLGGSSLVTATICLLGTATLHKVIRTP